MCFLMVPFTEIILEFQHEMYRDQKQKNSPVSRKKTALRQLLQTEINIHRAKRF